ncbi:MAG: hypothetical protein ABFS22_10080, partial [Pseudomonadota bacterium]
MQRSAETRWKLADKKTYKEYEDKISEIKQKAPDIGECFQFHEDYDLSDALIDALYWYVRSRPRLLNMKNKNKECIDRLEIIREEKSFENAR